VPAITITDDVTHRMLCCQTDIHIKNSKSISFTQNNVGFIIQVMTHRLHQKLRHCLSVHYSRCVICKIKDVLKYFGFTMG